LVFGMVAPMLVPELRGCNVVVTGGANGIGEAIVRAFHGQGAHVFFCDLDVRAGRTLAKQLGERANFQKLDLIREREIVRWIDDVGRHGRAIHALVNNAARDPRIALERASVEDWDDLFATNLRAYFLTCREAVPWMGAGSSIVNLASITFHNAPAEMTAYVATKGGVLGFTRSLARELGPRRIRVNTVSPGWVMTERQLRQYVTGETKKLIRRSQCIPDLIQPDEIASVVLFLASAASGAMTGQELLVDRGWHYS
jgi:NAD(P)-dependent dehydrogenase (short-subunit alcohol dehydrogenase family)